VNPLDLFALDFMRNAFLAGSCIAVAAGLVGYFVVLRNQVFTADSLGHTAFTGSLGGLLLGLNVLVGAFASCIAMALAIGTLGGRGRGRDVAVGTIFAWVLGLGALFLSLYTTSLSAGSGTVGVAVLFGSILGLQPTQVVVSSIAGAATSLALLLIARPLLFLSVDPEVAATRGVPTGALTALFLILIAVTVAEAVQAVGALLIFALMVTPAAIAQNLSARPWLGLFLSAAIAVAVVWGGLVLSFYVALPAGFFITALAFGLYLASRLPRPTAVALAGLLLFACGSTGDSVGSASSGKVEVVAAENFWGSIAQQTAGDRAHVTSIVVNPATDPHDYEPTPADARRFAQAGYVILNGAGYDAWGQKLLDANPVSGRKVLVISDLLGKKVGDNPHFWYSPAYVDRVIDRIASDLGTASAAAEFKSNGLKPYRDTIAAIRAKHAGTRVGATESIFVYVAEATGLDLVTPPGYMNAISEGSEPAAADKATVTRQIADNEIKVLVFNAQNSTPEVQSLVDKATAAGIPVVKITETPDPAGQSFQQWQNAQLQSLLHALGD
jgi:zinc/manganese transport system substrate-binding protein